MRKILTIIFVLALSTFAFGQDGVKIGYIDMQQALNDSEAGKAAKAELEKLVQGKQAKIDEKVALRDKLLAEIEKQSVVLSEDAMGQKEEELDKLSREIERMASDARIELDKSQREYELSIVKDLDEIIKEIGKNGGYTVLLPADVMLYATDGIDVTDTVIEKLNARYKSKPKAGSGKR